MVRSPITGEAVGSAAQGETWAFRVRGFEQYAIKNLWDFSLAGEARTSVHPFNVSGHDFANLTMLAFSICRSGSEDLSKRMFVHTLFFS